MPERDFATIENDYAFFMAHSTEAEQDAAEYARELAPLQALKPKAHDAQPSAQRPIRLLDFGCGTGEFLARLLAEVRWAPKLLEVTLVEPMNHQRDEAARRLASFTAHPITRLDKLPDARASQFDVVLSNHALYYVEDLEQTLDQLYSLVRPGGRLLLAVAGWDNTLMKLWRVGFSLLGRPVPYYAAEDVEAALSRRAVPFRRSQVHYKIQFRDTPENRLKILRFLFGEYLREIPASPMLDQFAAHTHDGTITIPTHCEHFAVEKE